MAEQRSELRLLRAAAVEIAVFSFFVNALMLVLPIYMLQVYDRILPSSSIETLTFLSIMAGGALLLLAVLEVVRGIYANRMAARLDVSQSQDAMLAAMEAPRASLGDVQTMRDLGSVRSFLSSRSVFALFDLPYAPLFIALLWLIHPVLFWITAIGAVVLVLLAGANQLATAGLTKSANESGIAAMMTAQSFVRNAETLRAMGMRQNAVSAWARQHVPALNANDRIAATSAIFTGVSRFLRLGLQIAVLGVGALLVVQGQMTAGMIFAAVVIAGRGLQPIDQIIGGWRQFSDVRSAWLRFRKATKDGAADRVFTDLPVPDGRLEIERLVYFPPNAAPQSEPVLKRIGFSVPQGKIVGIVGPSGAGKSTLARCVVGAVQPRGGVVRLDGADIRNWPSDRLGRHIGYLPQEVELLPGTVAENIARFDTNADDADVVRAAERAQVHDLIQSLPAGYDTIIGPNGLTLSGGQRQRIGLARAFYGEPCLLVLDEPNSNLDSDGESALERALDEARAAGATVLVIAQRTAIIGKVDLLLVLRAGTIEDYGPRDEVAARLQNKDTTAAGSSPKGAFSNKGQTKNPSPFAGYGPGMRPLVQAANDEQRDGTDR